MKPNAQKLIDALKKVAAYSKRDDLIRRSGWGELNFDQAAGDVSSVIRMAQDIIEMPVDLLPDTVIDQGTQATTALLPQLQNLANFSIMQGGDPTQRKNSLITQLHNATDFFEKSVGLWIPYLAYHRGDAEENIKKLGTLIKDVEDKGAEHIKELERKKQDAADLIERIKSTSAEAGVAVYTQDFLKESQENDECAQNWLNATITFASITIVALIGFYFWKIGETDWVHMLPMLGCRVLTISLLFTATIWSGRMYKAMRNQAIQNRHRALGLKTFRAFVDATLDAQTKDAVLRETTHAIFNTMPTGLIGESGQGDVDPSIVQVAGGMLSAASGAGK